MFHKTSLKTTTLIILVYDTKNNVLSRIRCYFAENEQIEYQRQKVPFL